MKPGREGKTQRRIEAGEEGEQSSEVDELLTYMETNKIVDNSQSMAACSHRITQASCLRFGLNVNKFSGLHILRIRVERDSPKEKGSRQAVTEYKISDNGIPYMVDNSKFDPIYCVPLVPNSYSVTACRHTIHG